MALAEFTDANRYLDGSKVEFANAEDAEPDRISAERYVRAFVSDVFGDEVVDIWDVDPSPPTTTQVPELVTELVAMLMASYLYQRTYSLESNTSSDYANALQARVESILMKLRSGEMTLIEIDVGSLIAFGQASFWPNDTYVFQGTLTPNRKFIMDMEF